MLHYRCKAAALLWSGHFFCLQAIFKVTKTTLPKRQNQSKRPNERFGVNERDDNYGDEKSGPRALMLPVRFSFSYDSGNQSMRLSPHDLDGCGG